MELAVRHGMARSSVREKLARLKSMGLVVSRRGSGHYINEHASGQRIGDALAQYIDLQRDAGSFRELLVLRKLIECECVAILARQEDDAGRNQLRASLRAMQRAQNDMAGFGRRDLAFHRVLVETSGNRLFLAVINGCFQKLGERFAQKTYRMNTRRIPEVLHEHEAICNAVDARHVAAARKALATHLDRSLHNLEKFLGKFHS